MKRSTFEEILFLLVEWLTRIRSAWTLMFYGGVTLIGLSLGGFTLIGVDGERALLLTTATGTPVAMSSSAFYLGVLLTVTGMAGMIFNAIKEHRANERKRVVVIEQRG